MNTLEEKLQKDLVEAIKSHNVSATSAIRSIKTAIMFARTAEGGKKDLDDNDIMKIIQRLSKQRQESIDIYTQSGREELATTEKAEKRTLDSYLPKMLTEDELKSAIDEIISKVENPSMKAMGLVMKELSAKYPSQYDGKAASSYIKEKLQ